MKKFYIRTFGCQMNSADSGLMGAILESRSFERCERQDEADLIIFNSCSVRAHAEDRMFSNLGLAMKKNPEAYFILSGCTVKRYGEKLFRRFPRLGALLAPSEIFSIGDIAEKVVSGGRAARLEGGSYGFIPRKGAVSEFVVIQTGCDNYCSYCVVPFLRDRERYRPSEDILNEARCLAESGTKEIVFLGQNVNSYRDDAVGCDFTELIRRVSAIEGLKRIRFLTSHPKDIPQKLIDEFGRNPLLARHLHLPAQSGSDPVLRAMNRKYSAADYLAIIEKLRKSAPDIALTTDIIAGFPGETDDDFEQTLSLVRKADFDGVYVFKYSPREGTAAFDMKDDVSGERKKERLASALALAKELALKKREAWIDRRAEVLFESDDVGHSSQNYLVFKKGAKAGDCSEVLIKAVSGFRLIAE